MSNDRVAVRCTGCDEFYFCGKWYPSMPVIFEGDGLRRDPDKPVAFGTWLQHHIDVCHTNGGIDLSKVATAGFAGAMFIIENEWNMVKWRRMSKERSVTELIGKRHAGEYAEAYGRRRVRPVCRVTTGEVGAPDDHGEVDCPRCLKILTVREEKRHGG